MVPSLGLGGYFEYTGTDILTAVYFRVYTYATDGDPAPTYIQKVSAPGAGGWKISFYAGSVADALGAPIVVGSDTWQVKVVNNRLNPLVSPGTLFHTMVSGTMTDETFIIDSLANDIQVTTDYTDDLVWHGDTVVLEVWKNGVKEFETSKSVNLYQATHAVSSFPGGSTDPDLLSQLALEAPANQLPAAPDIVAGQPATTSDATPTVMWYHRADPEGGEIHYAVEFAQGQVNVGGTMHVDDTHASYRVFLSVDTPAYFDFSTDGGATWTSFSTLSGNGLVLAESAQNIVRVTLPDVVGQKLEVGQWYWQVRATDLTLA